MDLFTRLDRWRPYEVTTTSSIVTHDRFQRFYGPLGCWGSSHLSVVTESCLVELVQDILPHSIDVFEGGMRESGCRIELEKIQY